MPQILHLNELTNAEQAIRRALKECQAAPPYQMQNKLDELAQRQIIFNDLVAATCERLLTNISELSERLHQVEFAKISTLERDINYLYAVKQTLDADKNE